MTAFLRRSLIVLLLWLLLGAPAAFALQSPFLSLSVDPALAAQPVLACTLRDVANLLEQGFPGEKVVLNAREAQVTLRLEIVETDEGKPSGFLPWPSARQQGYRWVSHRQGDRIVLTLQAPSADALGNGLYGLLQEKLGFRFIHPRQTLTPRHASWPLPPRFTWEAQPRFARRGFHLHTLHPTELSQALNDPRLSGGAEAVRQYIDWLARNGQNLLQFYLLRDIDRENWLPHARTLIDYAHRRGIRIGCMVSVSMLQQKAFQLAKLWRWDSLQSQIRQSLNWLCQVPWDFLTIEFTLGEHLPDLRKSHPELESYLVNELEKRGIVAMIATHVIRNGDGKDAAFEPSAGNSGVLVHTVMCYSVTEPEAPVYGNRNLRFMARRALLENQRRETWFWPESAYWVAFDNSVPLMLLPYLETRYDDIRLMQEMEIPGHLTFSSGWEWGYWLTDWSIARWSWSYVGGKKEDGPLQYLAELFPGAAARDLWNQALASQNRYLKGLDLMPLMAASDPFSEMPAPFNALFQPRSELSCRNLLDDLPKEKVVRLVASASQNLEAFASEQLDIVAGLKTVLRAYDASGPADRQAAEVRRELVRALEITALRASHRASLLEAAQARRLHENFIGTLPDEANIHLRKAAALRARAQILVWEQERTYRYPLDRLAGRRPDLTAYHFGYLYPVSTLFFWQREEEQIRQGRCDAFFMKLWNFRRTLGLESLIF